MKQPAKLLILWQDTKKLTKKDPNTFLNSIQNHTDCKQNDKQNSIQTPSERFRLFTFAKQNNLRNATIPSDRKL